MKYSIIFKGEKKKDGMVKITMNFYKTGGNRVPKVIAITGPFNQWDNKHGCFNSVSPALAQKNQSLQQLAEKYFQIAERWNNEHRDWNAKEWAHALEKTEKQKNVPRLENPIENTPIIPKQTGHIFLLKVTP